MRTLVPQFFAPLYFATHGPLLSTYGGKALPQQPQPALSGIVLQTGSQPGFAPLPVIGIKKIVNVFGVMSITTGPLYLKGRSTAKCNRRARARQAPSRVRSGAPLLLIVLATFALGGCASSAASIATSVVLTAMGVKKDQGPPPPKTITVQVDTATNLNADSQGRGLSAVIRLYKLKDATSFKQASSEHLLDADHAKTVLGQDLLESKEELLIPGQHYQFKEKVDAQNGYLGIAVFFRKPHPQRWKLIVATADLKENSPLIVGAHACALNVTSGLADKKELAEKFYVASARCEK